MLSKNLFFSSILEKLVFDTIPPVSGVTGCVYWASYTLKGEVIFPGDSISSTYPIRALWYFDCSSFSLRFSLVTPFSESLKGPFLWGFLTFPSTIAWSTAFLIVTFISLYEDKYIPLLFISIPEDWKFDVCLLLNTGGDNTHSVPVRLSKRRSSLKYSLICILLLQ